ncbi:MAG: methionyl-tRNA formyltransferase [Ruminococcaceae bacterium]|nr:methionyl-tRNA formyltransferase [Oscillospiraceae bacterium]
MKILFMGTPDFAAVSLAHLLDQPDFTVVGVLTQPDKPKGRHMTLTPPPVKVMALEKGIPVWQPATLKDGAIAELLDELVPDAIAVVAYGKLLPEYVLNYPKYGCVNVHGSLLPAYRGAAPMQRSIMAGDETVGVTTMKMAKGMDTGDMYLKAEMPLTLEDDFESVHDGLADMGAQLLVHTLHGLEAGTLKAHPQDERLATHAAKIEKADCLLDFDRPARQVHFYARGLTPVPLPFAYLNGKAVKFTSLSLLTENGVLGTPGQVIALDDGRITVACREGAVVIDGVLPEGKKRMSGADFIRGRGISLSDTFTK